MCFNAHNCHSTKSILKNGIFWKSSSQSSRIADVRTWFAPNVSHTVLWTSASWLVLNVRPFIGLDQTLDGSNLALTCRFSQANLRQKKQNLPGRHNFIAGPSVWQLERFSQSKFFNTAHAATVITGHQNFAGSMANSAVRMFLVPSPKPRESVERYLGHGTLPAVLVWSNLIFGSHPVA